VIYTPTPRVPAGLLDPSPPVPLGGLRERCLVQCHRAWIAPGFRPPHAAAVVRGEEEEERRGRKRSGLIKGLKRHARLAVAWEEEEEGPARVSHRFCGTGAGPYGSN